MDCTKLRLSFVSAWGGKDFAILTWVPDGKPALVIQAACALDDGRRERCQAALTALLLELGFPE